MILRSIGVDKTLVVTSLQPLIQKILLRTGFEIQLFKPLQTDRTYVSSFFNNLHFCIMLALYLQHLALFAALMSDTMRRTYI